MFVLSQRHTATANRSLTVSATNNRPHCLYRRPASRQARKPANDRNNLDGCSMVKRQNRVNDPACNAPRFSSGNRKQIAPHQKSFSTPNTEGLHQCRINGFTLVAQKA